MAFPRASLTVSTPHCNHTSVTVTGMGNSRLCQLPTYLPQLPLLAPQKAAFEPELPWFCSQASLGETSRALARQQLLAATEKGPQLFFLWFLTTRADKYKEKVHFKTSYLYMDFKKSYAQLKAEKSALKSELFLKAKSTKDVPQRFFVRWSLL